MNWFETAGRVLVIVGIGALAGGILGSAYIGILAALMGVVVYWLYQMERVQRWLESPGEPPPDIFGAWGRLLSHIYLNERRSSNIQQQLQSKVDYLQSSFASMRDGVVMVDAHGAIKWFNKAAGPLMGLRYPQDAGQTLTNLVRSPKFNEYFIKRDYSQPLNYRSPAENPIHLRVEVTNFGPAQDRREYRHPAEPCQRGRRPPACRLPEHAIAPAFRAIRAATAAG